MKTACNWRTKQTMSVIWAFLPFHPFLYFYLSISFYIFLYFLHLSPFDFCCVLHSLWNLKPSCEMSSNGRCQGASCSFHSKRACWSLDEATAVATASISAQFNILQRSSKATASGAKFESVHFNSSEIWNILKLLTKMRKTRGNKSWHLLWSLLNKPLTMSW